VRIDRGRGGAKPWTTLARRRSDASQTPIGILLMIFVLGVVWCHFLTRLSSCFCETTTKKVAAVV
jgi:hypothetical protein